MGSSDPIRVRVLRAARRGLGLGVYTLGAVSGSPYARMLGLRAAAERALGRGELDEAELLADELLTLAGRYERDWYYGNAVHHAHSVLGSAALARGRLREAEDQLLAAADTPGSPQLSSFGPSLVLARDLLLAGSRDVVLDYLERCRTFWCPPDDRSAGSQATRRRLEGWIDEIRGGAIPDFGPNLVY